jgi:ribosomal protein L16 Arg81 hydroxylase
MRFTGLIDPLPPDQFFQRYWGQRPLVIHRADSIRYSHLLAPGDIEHLIGAGKMRYPDITVAHGDRLMGAGEINRPDGTADPVVIQRLFRGGGTVILFQLHRFRDSLARLCGDLEQDLRIPFQTNIYLTPPRSPGVRKHYDAHDVFLLQVAGAKDWTVYGPRVRLPLNGGDGTTGPETILRKFTLRPGDIAYIPRGYIHETATQDQSSLHITLGALQ